MFASNCSHLEGSAVVRVHSLLGARAAYPHVRDGGRDARAPRRACACSRECEQLRLLVVDHRDVKGYIVTTVVVPEAVGTTVVVPTRSANSVWSTTSTAWRIYLYSFVQLPIGWCGQETIEKRRPECTSPSGPPALGVGHPERRRSRSAGHPALRSGSFSKRHDSSLRSE